MRGALDKLTEDYHVLAIRLVHDTGGLWGRSAIGRQTSGAIARVVARPLVWGDPDF